LGHLNAGQFEMNSAQTFFDLAQMPNIGAPRQIERDPLRDVRMWRGRDFKEYLIFYSVKPDFVQIERVVHAKRDYKREV
jgi:toxin ParE1/3/4